VFAWGVFGFMFANSLAHYDGVRKMIVHISYVIVYIRLIINLYSGHWSMS
jgi:hypothetical protein